MYVDIPSALACAHRDQLLRAAETRRRGSVGRTNRTGQAEPRLRVRVLRARDADEIARLFDRLSMRSRYLRYFAPLQRLSEAWLTRLASFDRHTHRAVGAFDRGVLVAAAHYFVSPDDPTRAEVAVEVADGYQRTGIGSVLVTELARVARHRGVTRFSATALRENTAVVGLVRHLGWPAALRSSGHELQLVLTLPAFVDVAA
jgi:GNAT superfamily N-acetyltransferase